MRKTGRTKALLAMFLAAATLQAGTAFGAQATTGSQLQAGTWVKEAAGWKFRKPSGEMATGWIQTANGWYYLQPETGIMATGMLRINDRTYYFNANPDAVEGKMTTGWYQDAKGNWYFFSTTADSTEGAAVTGWQWVDGRSYYFEPAAGENYGKMFANGVTPDGYKVNADGQWVDENGKVQVVAGKGYASDPAKNKTTNTTVRGGGGGGSSRGSSGSSDTGNDASDNNNSNNTNNSNNNNNNNNNNNSNNNPDQTKSVFVKEDETKLVEVNSLGWWITVAFEDGYNAGNTKVYADGVDVTAALSNVTDDGSICKLAVIKPPSKLTVSNAADSTKTQTVSLDDEAADGVIYAGTSYLPEKILTHGPVALWDYYLTNYADDGSVRYSPSKTTFALGEKPVAHPAYSPDAELDENGKATVTIMFNYNTDEEKEWFDGINRLQLVEYNENKNPLNRDLVFDRAKNVAHGSGKVGELTIKAPQGNFTNNGRYYVRVESKAGTSALVPIHVVNAQAPVFKLKETPQSGVNMHFQVENMVYGIEAPINRVVLEGPTETVELKEIDDWFLYSQDLFVIYNDNVDHFKYKGDYKLTVYADGFKSTSVEFTVTKGENVPSKDEMGIAQYSFDGVSTASTGSGGSSGSGESGSGSSAISANLVFDTDLLVNAELLEEVGKSTAESEAVVDWWYGMAGVDAVFNKNDRDDKYYDWVDYLNAVESSKKTGIIPFEDYKRTGVVWSNSPATAKEVLEDGLLGEIQNNGDFSRPAAGAFTVTQNKENEDVVLTHEDKAYLAAIKNIVINDNWTGLTKEQYTVDAENGTLTLNKDLFKAGEEYKIAVEADGYQMNAFKITYDQILEEGISLTVKYEEGKSSYASEKRTLASKPGFYADATVEVTGSEGGFLKYLKSVVLDGDDTLYTAGVEGSDAAYYAISDDKKTLTITNIKPGTHTLTVRANGYVDVLTATIVVDEGEDEPEVTFVPVVKSLEYKEAGFFMSPANYYITFDNGTDLDSKNALAAYLDAVESVKVGEVNYSKAILGLGNDDDEFAASIVDGNYGSTHDCLRMTADTGFTGDTVEIVVEAEGYDTVTLTAVKNSDGRYVLKDGSDVNPPAEDTFKPEVTGFEYNSESFDAYYGVTFDKGTTDDDEQALKTYLENITLVKVGNIDYNKASLFWNVENEFQVTKENSNYSNYTDYLKLSENSAFNGDDDQVITIYADGYEELTFTVEKNSDGKYALKDGSDVVPPSEDNDSDSGITVTKLDLSSAGRSYSLYRLQFTEDTINGYEVDEYLRAVDSEANITVDGEDYSKAYSLYNDSVMKFKVNKTDSNGDYDCIDFTIDGFNSKDPVVVVINAGEEYGKLILKVDAVNMTVEIGDEDDTKTQELAEEAVVVTVPEEKEESQEPTNDESKDETKEDDTTASDNETPSVTPSESEESKDTEPSEEDKDESRDDSTDESKDDSTEEPETPSETEDGSDESEDSKDDASEDNSSESSEDSSKETSEDTGSGDVSEETEATETEGEI